MNERIIGLDIGDVRIGVAVSDPEGIIASPLEVIRRVGYGPDVKRIRAICDQWETERVVSGLPLNMDGSEGFQARKVRDLCDQLTAAGLTVEFQDERLTTVTAEEALISGGMLGQERRNRVDKVAAAIILQQYLDTQREKEAETMSEEFYDYDEEPSVVELIDEETGENVPFEHLATLEYEGKPYICLMPMGEDGEADEEAGVVIMAIETDDEGNEAYVTVEDEVGEKVFAKLLELMEEDDAEDEI